MSMRVWLSRRMSLLQLAICRLWWCIRAKFVSLPENRQACLILLPCDPTHVIGSRGDEAMVMAALQDYRSRCPEGRIVIIIGGSGEFPESPDGVRLTEMFRVSYVHSWQGRLPMVLIQNLVFGEKPTEFLTLGADCMDGHWAVSTSLILLFVSECCARMGIETHLTGFSFNGHPPKPILKAFRRCSQRLMLNLRDPISYQRFIQVLGSPLSRLSHVRLVADIAFCLKPQITPRVKLWMERFSRWRHAGKFVLGLNLHSMLNVELDKFLPKVADQVQAFVRDNPDVIVVLIPHDYRDGGDLSVLNSFNLLCATQFHLIPDELSAAELKALTRGLSALFTSRMHLGIAALGQGIPIAGFSYQGKFEGLFDSFGIDRSLLLGPSQVTALQTVLRRLFEKSSILRQSIASHIERVQNLSHLNLKS